jgi:hypothetical protein
VKEDRARSLREKEPGEARVLFAATERHAEQRQPGSADFPGAMDRKGISVAAGSKMEGVWYNVVILRAL